MPVLNGSPCLSDGVGGLVGPRLGLHRRGTPSAGFCSPACIEAHKSQLAHLRASHLEQEFGERLRDAGLAFVPQYPLGPYVTLTPAPEEESPAWHLSRQKL